MGADLKRVAASRSNSSRRNTRLRCDCGGYWFPHRKTGGACDHGPRRDFFIAIRGGATISDAMQELSADQLNRMFPIPPTSFRDDSDIPF